MSAAVDLLSAQVNDPPPLDLAADLREIYAQYCTPVWRSLRRLGVQESVVEDAVQDVFLVIHRRQGEFSGRSSLKTWIYGITLRVAKNYRRTERRHQTKLQRWSDEQAAQLPVAPSPVLAAERKQANLLLHQLLGELPEAQRELFVLVELEGLALREAAEIVGVKIRTGQRRLRAARYAFETAAARRLAQGGRST